MGVFIPQAPPLSQFFSANALVDKSCWLNLAMHYIERAQPTSTKPTNHGLIIVDSQKNCSHIRDVWFTPKKITTKTLKWLQ